MKSIKTKAWKWLNKTLEVKHIALYFLLLIILIESLIIFGSMIEKRYVYGLGEEEQFKTGLSHKCYETKQGKYCIVAKKVYWYERSDR